MACNLIADWTQFIVLLAAIGVQMAVVFGLAFRINDLRRDEDQRDL